MSSRNVTRMHAIKSRQQAATLRFALVVASLAGVCYLLAKLLLG